jgi:hypothetical protein
VPNVDFVTVTGWSRRGLRIEVKQQCGDLDAGQAVGECVVDAGNDGHPLIGQPIDDAEVPRWPLPVERLSQQLVALLPELLVGSGPAQVSVLDMVGDVEMEVVGPYRRCTR